MHLQVRCWFLDIFTASLRFRTFPGGHLPHPRQCCASTGEMRAEVLLVWVGLTLCCALVCAREDVKDSKLSRARALAEHRRQGEEVDVGMSDEPAEAVEEKSKPKKKKSPEEIEAGKWELLQTRRGLSAVCWSDDAIRD